MSTNLSQQVIQRLDAKCRIQRSVELLDRHAPLFWRRMIDLESFDLRGATNCILGQIYGDYVLGAMLLGIHGQPNHYGFCVVGGPEAPMWDVLEDAWLTELTKEAIAA